MAVAAFGQLNLEEPPPVWGSRSVDCFEKLEQIGEGTYGSASQFILFLSLDSPPFSFEFNFSFWVFNFTGILCFFFGIDELGGEKRLLNVGFDFYNAYAKSEVYSCV